jgi:O-antigen ligase
MVSLLVSPVVAIAAVVALVVAVGIVEDPAFGALAVAGFVILQIPEVATDFHGAPSLFAPLLALVGLALAARSIRSGEPIGGAGRAAIVITVLLAAALVSLPSARYAGDGLRAVVELAKDGAVAVVIGLLVRRTSTLRLVVWVLLGGGMFLAGLSILQFLTGAYGTAFAGFAQSNLQHVFGTYDDIRVSGPIEDPNFYAQWMVLLVPLAIDRFFDEVNPMLRLAAAGSALSSIAVVVITFSRGALLALVVVLGIMALRHPPRPAAIAAALSVGVLALPFLPAGYTERMLALTDIGGTDIGSDPSIRAREAEIIASTQMFLDDPLTGVGYGTYLLHYSDYVRDLGIEQTDKQREAHNLYLETAAETGVIGIAALATAIGAIAVALALGRRRFRDMGDHVSDGIGYALGASLVGYMVTSVFLHMAFARPVWLIVGLSLALPGLAEAERRTRDQAMAVAR